MNMKKLQMLITVFIGIAILTSACQTTKTAADQNGKEALKVLDINDNSIVYEVMDYDYPLADTVAKYSWKGQGEFELENQMTKYADILRPNMKGKASVLQFNEGIVVSLDRGDVFDSNEAMLTKNGKAQLRYLAFSLKKMPDTYIYAVGRTDATGTKEFNQNLSIKRAAYAANYLRGCGIAQDRFFIDGYGETFPDFANSSPYLRDKNRRVDFLIIPSNEMRKEAATK